MNEWFTALFVLLVLLIAMALFDISDPAGYPFGWKVVLTVIGFIIVILVLWVRPERTDEGRPRFMTMTSGSKVTQLPDKPQLGPLITGFVVNLKNRGKRPAYDVRSSLAIFPQSLDLGIMGGAFSSHINPVEPEEEYHHAENCLDQVSFEKQEALFAVFQMKYMDREIGKEFTQVFYFKWNTPERLYKRPEFEGISVEEQARILEYLKKQKFKVDPSTD